jgi:hypothetical protein
MAECLREVRLSVSNDGGQITNIPAPEVLPKSSDKHPFVSVAIMGRLFNKTSQGDLKTDWRIRKYRYLVLDALSKMHSG